MNTKIMLTVVLLAGVQLGAMNNAKGRRELPMRDGTQIDMPNGSKHLTSNIWSKVDNEMLVGMAAILGIAGAGILVPLIGCQNHPDHCGGFLASPLFRVSLGTWAGALFVLGATCCCGTSSGDRDVHDDNRKAKQD